jgi:hypothetical protein
MNKKDWTYIIIAMVVVAVVVSVVMGKIGGNASLSPAQRTGVTTYTKADIDTMLSEVYSKMEIDAMLNTKISPVFVSDFINVNYNNFSVVNGKNICENPVKYNAGLGSTPRKCLFGLGLNYANRSADQLNAVQRFISGNTSLPSGAIISDFSTFGKVGGLDVISCERSYSANNILITYVKYLCY